MALSQTTIERMKRVRSLMVKGIKKFLTFLLSHVGLTLAVAAYGMLGGIIFMNLEAPFEKEKRQDAVRLRENLAVQFLELTDIIDVSDNESEWSTKADAMLLEFQDKMHRLTKDSGWDGKEVDEESQWSFAGSLLYSVTVITTIGYGHIAPKTPWGRIVTIIYAIFGIPLTLLCLRNIGSFLSVCVSLFYKYTCIKVIKQYKLCRRRMHHSRRLKYLTQLAKKRGLRMKLLEGRPEIIITADADDDEEPEIKVDSSSVSELHSRSPSAIQTLEINELKRFASLTDSLNKDPEEKPDEKVRVPLTLTFAILTGYIVGGAVMFGLWEKDWDYLIGSYFCFITLSTIGFGDFVPGTSTDSWSNKEKNIICSAYLLFGMAIMAMCFHLMQEEVRLKFRHLATKLGLFTEEDSSKETENI